MTVKQDTWLYGLSLLKHILKRCLFTAAILIACLGVTVLWLFSTASGLKTVVYGLQSLLPGALKIEKITGSILKDILLEGIHYQDPQKMFTAKMVAFRGDWQRLLQKNIVLPYFQVEKLHFSSRDTDSTPEIALELETGRGKFMFFDQGNRIHLDLQNIKGQYNHQAIYIEGGALLEKGLLTFQSSTVLCGDHRITVHPKSENSSAVQWVYDGKLPKITSSENNDSSTGDTIKLYGDAIFSPLACTLSNTDLLLNNKKTAVIEGSFLLENASDSFSMRPMQGNLQIEILNLLPIHHFLPMIARLQARPKFKLKITGNVMKPVISVQGDIGTASFSIPKQKINVKQFQLEVSGLLKQDLKVKGSGYIHGHPFYLDGLWNPLIPGMPGKFYFTGQSLRLFNTQNIHIIASPDLHLDFHGKTLAIEGSVEIMEGDIVLDKELSNVVISNDVVYVEHNHQPLSDGMMHLQPDIQFVLKNDLRFKGHGLDANIGGKLRVMQREDGIYTGQGRIVIRNGKYRLPSGIGNIYRGYLYYPAGTPLQDPILDIRVLQQAQSKLNTEGDVGIYVQGSLQKPVYHLYSSQDLQQNAVLSKLGFGGTQFEGEDAQGRMLAQGAVLLGGGNNPLLENIQSKFGLEKLGIESGNTSQYVSTSENDATLVVAKALSKRVHLQFMQGIFIPNNTLMLQYFITPYLFISGQTSTTGLGADLSFSVEKD